jgi:hypothetical protein
MLRVTRPGVTFAALRGAKALKSLKVKAPAENFFAS